ncbi:MAG: hypothetical protein KF819_37800 [Labilithrix sp.]|nr:hypothetical protein [Labilithrix sp.]
MRGVVVLTMAMLVVAACTTDFPPCYRGEYRGCSCPDGARGYESCNITQDGFGACVCDGRTPGVAGIREAGADVVESGPPTGTYMQPCAPNNQCTDGTTCALFPNKGSFCTKPCKDPTDCPPPAKTCSSMRGVCAAP